MADVKRSLLGGHHSNLGGTHTKGRSQKNAKNKKDERNKKTRGLGWNRIRLTIQALSTVSIDTGIGGENFVEDEPPLGISPPELSQPLFTNPTGASGTSLLVPLPGTVPASRLMVIPLSPINSWSSITMPTEPFWNTATRTAWITLANSNELLSMEINVLVCDPLRHSPGRADTYTSKAA
jgi:hypothetical protein